MNHTEWIQELATLHSESCNQVSSSLSPYHYQEIEDKSWDYIRSYSSEIIDEFNRYSPSKIRQEDSGDEQFLLFLGSCQLRFKKQTGMINVRLDRVQGYQFTKIVALDLKSQYDGITGVYWLVKHQAMDEHMLLKMAIEALVRADGQNYLKKKEQNAHSISNTRS